MGYPGSLSGREDAAGEIRYIPCLKCETWGTQNRSAAQGDFEGGLQSVEEGFLAAEDFLAGGGEVEPGAAVGFWDFDLAAGARGPFDETGVGDEGGGVEVAFDGPGGDLLAGGLGDDAQGEEVGEVAGKGSAGFFLEFAAGGGEGLLVCEVFAFGDGPGVFFGPEGAAGVDEEDFEAGDAGGGIEARGAAIEEDAGGGFGHCQGTGYRL
jgi:hypothetical protein